MHDGKLYMAVLQASLFGVSIPVMTDDRSGWLPSDDAALALRVRRQLQTDKDLRGSVIHVRCQDGEIYLSGLLMDEQRERAVKVAHGVPGVVRVHNLIARMPRLSVYTH